MAFVDELQNDIPDLVKLARDMANDLGCAESCDSKEDFCANLRSAILKATMAKQELTSLLKKAQKCVRFSE